MEESGFRRNGAEDAAYGHRPVLLQECLAALEIRPDGTYLDGTLGRAGHSLEIVRRLTTGRLIGVDRDEAALTAARERLRDYMDRVTLVHNNFERLDEILDELGIGGVDGMLFDLGVSSPQLDDAGRGFSYMHNASLDMRMDRTAALTARQVVNEWSYEELRRILYEYGEERYAPAIAAAICRQRDEAPIETTLELAELIRRAMPAKALREKQHPAKRSFQAIRIAVNGELDSLPPMLAAAAERLRPGGRLAVISFHSLEDRIIKRTLQELATGCTCPPEFPVCVCGRKPKLRLITRKPVTPGPAELTYNPRARSAKLRVAEKL
ncbi:MAG: 16S rRNA (cytosine(1402)-N(4))-methyltransferase RsmH [Ruminococcaceae bacterium]|jgi:16S rRNA (cytosine1402-N4)-methyltransferase|nr:16S rRNA (cytosine(1402)-N(4))-methyltransferase RsmH [Oscillospiraceae bacterium]